MTICLSPPVFANDKNQSEHVVTTQTEFGLEMIYAMMGSAAGNGGALVLFILLDIVPGFFESPDFVPPDLVSNPLVALLLIAPAVSVAITMHFFYPQVKEVKANLFLSILGNLLGVLVHSLLMIPIFLNFQRPTISESVTTLAPIALITAVLIESLFTVFFYDWSKSWDIKSSASAPGLLLVKSFKF